jgi:glutathione peroxidase-family protein
MTRFHDLSMQSINGEDVSFADFQGKLCLVVNVASR